MTMVRLCSNGDYWQARWVLPGGRRVSQSIGAKSEYSRRAAEIEVARIQREVEDSTQTRLGNKVPKLSEYLARWIDSRTDLAETTLRLHRLSVARLKEFFPRDPRIDTITPADAADFKTWCSRHTFQTEDRGKYTLSEASVKRHIVLAKQVFDQAEAEEVIPRNPFARVKTAQVRSDKQWAYVGADELGRIMEACPTPGHRCLFALARWAGLRLGEAMRLQWADVDLEARTLTVRNPLGKRTTKKRTRVVPIQPRLLEVLREDQRARPRVVGGPCDDVTKGNIYRRVEWILERAKVAVYKDPFHTLRRNLLTDWIAEFPPMDVASWLGHDIKVAMEFYHKSKPETMARVTGHGIAKEKKA